MSLSLNGNIVTTSRGDEFYAYITFLSDPAFDSFSKEHLLEALPSGDSHSFIMVVDSVTLSHVERPILVVDLWRLRGREFRATTARIQGIENNLSIANMDFHEFAENVDSDGIFRGFP